MPNNYIESLHRIPKIQTRIAKFLRLRGEEGCTNVELQKFGISWQRRVCDLYRLGYVIKNEPIGDGVYRYVLVSEPLRNIKFKIESPNHIIFKSIIDQYDNSISVADLKELMATHRITFTREKYYYKNLNHIIKGENFDSIFDMM